MDNGLPVGHRAGEDATQDPQGAAMTTPGPPKTRRSTW
ncbi:hypothetical protein SGL43_00095 [Streptomyces globisporus]|uniref:Uncharacterized protein n=1 Tax=Streptomyces globisporus TaxID=1908 RepID=A0ABN8USB9_STRGL|nr:hypothetical protein SGL43_00095 [Streptomyces globisporus]